MYPPYLIYRLGDEVCFHDQADLAEDLEFLYVYCYGQRGKLELLYQNLHSIVVDKKLPHVSLNNETSLGDGEMNGTTWKRYSVMLFGIDSISRLNFIRTMSNTKTFLEHHNWTWLEGYNKVADNTFPNLIAILTGMNVSQLFNTCYPSQDTRLDDCPFLWNEYSKQGYLTAYFEDEVQIGTFNFERYGFLNAPTDYYGRPYMMAGEALLKPEVKSVLPIILGFICYSERCCVEVKSSGLILSYYFTYFH